jgi:hypothetical protein
LLSVALPPADVRDASFDRVQTRADLVQLCGERVGPPALETSPRGLDEGQVIEAVMTVKKPIPMIITTAATSRPVVLVGTRSP